VTIDGAKELISAVEETFPSTMIQSCVFHLFKRLKKKLRIEDEVMDTKVMVTRLKVKNLIMNTAIADQETRNAMFGKLLQMADVCEDKKALKAIQDFMNTAHYYHSLEELNGHWEALTTNTCESHIKQVKCRLGGRLFGFKSLATAQKHIDLYWQEHTYKRLQNWDILSGINSPRLRLLLRGHIPLSKLVEILNIKYSELVEICTKNKMCIVTTLLGCYPVPQYLIKRTIRLAQYVETVGQLAEILAVPSPVVYNILTLYGHEGNYKLERVNITLHENFEEFVQEAMGKAKILTSQSSTGLHMPCGPVK
jgi:hypothetical protein